MNGHASTLAVLLAVLVGVVPTPAGTPTTGTPRSPSESRVPPAIETYFDKDAADLLELVTTRPSDAKARLQLASRYRSAAPYARVSELFEATARFLEDGKVDIAVTRPALHSLEGCHIRAKGSLEHLRELEKKVKAACEAVSKAIQRDQSREGSGLAAAEQAIGVYGPLCPLLAEWAAAYLWQTALHPERADTVLREAAIRLLVTVGEEENEYPAGSEGKASIYMVVADMFWVRKDYVSAYVALLISQERLQSGSVTGSVERASFETMLAERIVEAKYLASRQRQEGH